MTNNAAQSKPAVRPISEIQSDLVKARAYKEWLVMRGLDHQAEVQNREEVQPLLDELSEAELEANRLTPENLLAAGFTEDAIRGIRMFWFDVRDGFLIRYIKHDKHDDWSICRGKAIDGIPDPVCPLSMGDVQWLIKRCRSWKDEA